MKMRLHAAVMFALATVLVLAFATPLFVHAQGSDLRSTIRAELLSDPRSSGMSSAQIDAMVAALTAAAEKKGLSARDISWHPVPVSSVSVTATAGNIAACDQSYLLCQFSAAFGFSGPDLTIPIWFGITSPVLVLILWGMIGAHRRTHAAAPNVTPQ